ncbi:5-deoxy-glucuronate isomerase [Microtetraspora sp. NBRC 16547]|uniref:5-deoxy-glucuronate isomerase n=1 Tax=Microtetraspora sp. NBRC 16547 TaxID=3030993 RepID=UPI0024A5CCFC|nr:5-deoxy-glucuronate isomerase [Microtetraspora sp. NBRC 16547]GLW98280.1 5-deoxy-glucuronate isomerase [Microtetraspora sp. NBRC 16547]
MNRPQVLRRGWQRITPELAGWTFVSFEVVTLPPGREFAWRADHHERALVPIEGEFEAVVGNGGFRFGRPGGVFAATGSCLYAPREMRGAVRSDRGGQVAIASAPARERREPHLVTPDMVDVEVRGAGVATRQVGNLLSSSAAADRLLLVEVWTPGGNWSGYPPHKHERDTDTEAQLEELYYYRTRDPDAGWAIQRIYSPERNFDLSSVVSDGDISLMPWGYHTTVAAPGHDLYYLCVLAGPSPARQLRNSIDPRLAPFKDSWPSMTTDERVPMVMPPSS